MKPQVFTISRSADEASAARRWPLASSSCSIASESTVFLAQPSETITNVLYVAVVGASAAK